MIVVPKHIADKIEKILTEAPDGKVISLPRPHPDDCRHEFIAASAHPAASCHCQKCGMTATRDYAEGFDAGFDLASGRNSQ